MAAHRISQREIMEIVETKKKQEIDKRENNWNLVKENSQHKNGGHEEKIKGMKKRYIVIRKLKEKKEKEQQLE